MDRIDFRSDTVSWPTAAMREAMATAVVGDDVYGEDPTVLHLEALAAQKVGKEAALFVSSGTMGNLIAILTHANRGEEAILGQDAHTYRSEAGGMAVLGGVFPKPLATDSFGRMDLQAVEAAVSPDNPHYAKTTLILVENSYGNKHGYPLPPNYFAEIQAIASRQNLAVHMDGARLFNAAVARNISADQITQHVDSVTFCLSKGLSAPVGSILCGSQAFIQRARRNRKLLGGGMRQVGVLAAAGIVALSEMIERLDEDHRRAHQLATALAQIPGLTVQPEMVKTNMVFFDLDEDIQCQKDEVTTQLQQRANIWIGNMYGRSFRAVTHYWIKDNHIERLVDELEKILKYKN